MGDRRRLARLSIETGGIPNMCRLLPLCFLLLSTVARAGDSPVCDEHRDQAAYIMDARLEGARRQELAADLAGGGPPPPRLIRLITDVYELPIEDLSGTGRAGRLDEFHGQCVRREGG